MRIRRALRRRPTRFDRARIALAAKRIRRREDDKPLGELTFSAGVVSRRDRTLEATIDAADSLLYAAKSEGRNNVSSERHLIDVDARRAPRSA